LSTAKTDASSDDIPTSHNPGYGVIAQGRHRGRVHAVSAPLYWIFFPVQKIIMTEVVMAAMTTLQFLRTQVMAYFLGKSTKVIECMCGCLHAEYGVC